jgi:orotate phosphoribosyltransferase
LVAGPATGGTLLAHTIAGLLDSRRSLTYPPCLFAPFHHSNGSFTLRDFYRREIKGKRVLLADDVRNTGETFEYCANLVKAAGGEVLATVEIYDRMESVTELSVPNFALAEYKAPDNFRVSECPLCKAGMPITRF